MSEIIKKDVENEIKEELQIHDEDLETELKEQSTKLFFRGSMWAKALRAERQQKLFVESLEAQLSQEFRDLMLKTEPNTRITEKMLKEYVAGSPVYKEAQQKLIQAGYVSDVLNVAKMAFESRGRMLLELARQRGENEFYDNEYLNMKNEFERKEEVKARKRTKKQEELLNEQQEN